MASEDDRPIVILGAGLTGLSTAFHLSAASSGGSRRVVLAERGDRVGGKAVSERHHGYTFDVTGHWLHLRADRVRDLVGRLFAPGDLVEIERRTGVYTHGAMLAYPFQANLHGLPLPLVRDCLVAFMEAQVAAASSPPEPTTFEQFAIARFGRGIAEHFFVPYNTKLWGMHPNRLTARWVTRFIPVPDMAQVVGGAIGLRQEGLGYNVRFLYPKAGGIDALPNALGAALGPSVQTRLGTQVESIIPATRRVKLSGDSDYTEYHALVSTIPLPALIDRIVGAPAAVTEAAARLRCVPWRYLNVATKTPVPIAEHWVYVPDPGIPFFRVGVYSNALEAMAPPGCGSLYVELTDRENPPDLPAIYAALADMGAISSVDDVLFSQVRDVPCAYVLFDDAYEASTQTIFAWLQQVGIRSCGRYGGWVYNSMEDAIIAGMDAAQELVDG